MATKVADEIPIGMQRVCRRFERWRSGHKARLPIPNALWRAAAQAARRQSGCRRTRHAPYRRPVPGVSPAKSLPPERAGNAGPVRGPRTAGGYRVRDGAATLQRVRGGLHS
jgi:hypothetical protein